MSGISGDTSGSQTNEAISRALGQELRRTREERGWSRKQLVNRLPSGIGERTLLAYEHGARHFTALRLIEICRALEVDASTLLARALQRARLHLDSLVLTVDLRALSRDRSDTFRPMAQWARNCLNQNPGGTVDVEPSVVQNLALFIGCQYLELANHLARFMPDA